MPEDQPEFNFFTCAGCQKRFRVRAGKTPPELCSDCRRVESQIAAARPDATVDELAGAVRAEQVAKAEKRAAEASQRVQEEQSRGLAMVFKPAEVESDLDDTILTQETLDASTQSAPSVFKPVPTRPSGEKLSPAEKEVAISAAAEAYTQAMGPPRDGTGATCGQTVLYMGLASIVIGATSMFFGAPTGASTAAVLTLGALIFYLSKIERRLSEILHETRSRKR
jgi:hypothetical protein